MTETRALHGRRLRELPIPRPDPEGDKEERGRVLVAGGSREVPGAVILAGTAVLRAGAGKLQTAAPAGIALAVAAALPEGRVFALPESGTGGIAPEAAGQVRERAEQAQALLLGPGMLDPEASLGLSLAVLRDLSGPAVVLDSGALPVLHEERGALRGLGGRAVITPHAGEMALILGADRREVEESPLEVALRSAAELGAVVVLKGPETHLATPDGTALRYSLGRVGLATSGSGDVLAGLVAGLLGRGADPLAAAAWGVYLHGEAGNRLSRRVGAVGFLARELPGEVPGILERLQPGG